MVSAISKGRFGNFCFVNMAAYVYSLKHGLEFHIQDKSLAPHLWPLHFQELKNPNWDETKEVVFVNDDKHTYTELPFKEEWRDKNIIIGTTDINTGYFQSFLYLKGYEKQIKQKFFNQIRSETYVNCDNNSASLHVRRSDYLQLQEFHPTITMDYILRAIVQCICFNIEGICIYSDDTKWCKENIIPAVKKFSDIAIIVSKNNSEIFDFYYMMHHPINIISNSSFSLLASILNTTHFKKVISPTENDWYGIKNKKLSVETMIPKEYIRIKY